MEYGLSVLYADLLVLFLSAVRLLPLRGLFVPSGFAVLLFTTGFSTLQHHLQIFFVPSLF